MNLTGTLSSNGYRFPPFHFSLLSTAIVSITGNSLLSSSSSLTTVSTLWLVICHRVEPISTSHLWLLLVWIHHSSASVFPSFSSCWGAKRDRGGFLPPHHPGKSLGPGGAVSAPKGSLRAGSAFFAGYYSHLFYINKALGSWRPILILALLCTSYIILKEMYLLFPMHPYSGYFLRFMAFGKVFQFLALCLVSPRLRRSSRGSWLRFGVFSTVLDSASALSARLAHSGVFLRVDFLSLRTFLWLCNFLEIVVDWEMSQLVAHQ